MNRYLTSLLALWPYLATTQTAPGFSPATNNSLDVKFPKPGHLTISPGHFVPEEDTELIPAIRPPIKHHNPQNTYFLIMLDQDIPLTPNLTTTGLHWLAQDLTFSSCDHNFTSASREQSIVAPYKPPTPLFNSGAHTYTILLFKQPCNFEFPKAYEYLDPPKNTSLRIGFNTSMFVEVAGLGELVGATYWLEINGTADGNATETTPQGGLGTDGSGAAQVSHP